MNNFKLFSRIRTGFGILFLCFFFFACNLQAQLIYNFNFEAGNLNCQGPDGWRSNNNVQVANVYQPGNKWVDITGCRYGNGNWIEQDVQVIPGTVYFISIDLGSWWGWDDEDAGVDITINGVALGQRYFNDSFTGNPAMKLFWKTIHTCAFVPSTNTVTIRITGHGLCTKTSPQRACDNPVPGVIAVDNVLLQVVEIQTPAQVCLQNGSAGLSYVYKGKPCDYKLVWQKDGVKLGSDSVLNVNAPGVYKLILDFACVKVEKTIRVNAGAVSDTILSVCNGGTILFNGRYIYHDSDVLDTFQMAGDCDSVVLYRVRFSKVLNPYPDQKYFFCENGYDSFSLRAGNAAVYEWLPGGQTTKTRYADKAGIYRVVMRDSMGCADTAVHELISSCIPPHYIPNTFTPNGDGRNDVFLPYFMGAESFRLQIFNRWGELLYDSFDTGLGWDGYYKQILCQQSAYLYLVSVVTRSSKVRYHLNGTITLLR